MTTGGLVSCHGVYIVVEMRENETFNAVFPSALLDVTMRMKNVLPTHSDPKVCVAVIGPQKKIFELTLCPNVPSTPTPINLNLDANLTCSPPKFSSHAKNARHTPKFSSDTMSAGGNTNRVCHFKLVLLGDTAVGKSCLVVRFVRDEYFEYQEPTIGGDATLPCSMGLCNMGASTRFFRNSHLISLLSLLLFV